MLARCKRFAGTSGGAIIAALLAVELSFDDIYPLMSADIGDKVQGSKQRKLESIIFQFVCPRFLFILWCFCDVEYFNNDYFMWHAIEHVRIQRYDRVELTIAV